GRGAGGRSHPFSHALEPGPHRPRSRYPLSAHWRPLRLHWPACGAHLLASLFPILDCACARRAPLDLGRPRSSQRLARRACLGGDGLRRRPPFLAQIECLTPPSTSFIRPFARCAAGNAPPPPAAMSAASAGAAFASSRRRFASAAASLTKGGSRVISSVPIARESSGP